MTKYISTILFVALSFIASGNDLLGFEENKGQVTGTDAQSVHFTYSHNNLKVFLLESSVAYQFEKSNDNQSTETFRVNLVLQNANAKPIVSMARASSDYTHYYKQNALFVKHYKTVTYHDVYPNIDWVFRTTTEGIKYDFIVHPGGNPSDIQLKIQHANDVRIDEAGDLEIHTLLGDITEAAPISYQGDAVIKSRFNLDQNVLRFELGEYNPTKTLEIDPSIVWSSYYGGTNQEYAYATYIDAQDNVYLTGFTKSTSNIADGGHQNSLSGSNYADAYVVKFNSAGKRQWATYYGGSGEDRGHDIAVDNNGNVFLTGRTRSSSDIAKDGALNTFRGIEDAFLVKFNSSGVRQWGTYYGGRGIDYANGVVVDKDGNSYIAVSSNSTTYQAVVVKYDKDGKRLWNAILGDKLFGTFCEAIALDPGNAVYVTGRTSSKSTIAKNGHQSSLGGGVDGYLIKLSLSGATIWGTYYGGSEIEDCVGVTVDDSSNVYMVGTTKSTSAIASSGHQNSFGGNQDGFIVKFSASGNRQWASYYGGTAFDNFTDVATDTAYNVYCSGYTGSTASMTANGIQNSYGGGGSDGLLVKFNSSGVRQFGTYVGGSDIDRLYDVVVDDNDNILTAGYTKTANFFNKNGHQTSLGGDYDGIVMKISQCVADPGTAVVEACDSYTWIDGKTYTESTNAPQHTITSKNGCDSTVTLNLTINKSPRRTETLSVCGPYTAPNGTTYNRSGSYDYTIPVTGGCDSIITLNLTVTDISTEVTMNGRTLRAREAGGSYQWLDCNNNYSVINGATNREYSATADGRYAAEVNKNGCTDTTVCTMVTPSGIETMSNKHSIKIYPNPNNGTFTINLGEENGYVRIVDVNGKMIQKHTDITDTRTIHLAVNAGVYYVHISTEFETYVHAVIIN